jgi:hypothetical protein
MEYKFASDYAREIGRQIQSDVDRIVQSRQRAADRAREERRYQEQQQRYARSEERALRQENRAEDRYNEQLYGYTKTAMETAPSAVGGWAVEGLQLSLDEYQRAATQHRLDPTDENSQRFQQAKAQYDKLKNVSTAKFALNSKTMNEVRSGKMKNLAGGVQRAEEMYQDYSQSPEWVLAEDGKLMVVGDGGLTDWNTTRYATTDDVFVPQVRAEETPFASSEYSKTLFDESYNAKRRSYTVTNAEGFALGELDSERLFSDVGNSITDRIRTNPQMMRQMAFEQWKRDNPGKDYMTEADQQTALATYNPGLAQRSIDGESISTGKLNAEGRFVFNVTDAQIDANKDMNSEQKRAMKQWREATSGYYEATAQGIAGRMEPVDQRAELARLNQSRANAQAEAEAGQQEAVNEALGATYAVNQREGGYAVSLPARDNVRVDLRGPGRVNVSQILYDTQGGTIGYRTSVRNDVVQSALEQASSAEDRAQILEFFNAYRDRVVSADDPEFEAINLSVVNDDKVAGRLKFVPAKIVGHSQGLFEQGLGETGIDQNVLVQLQARQQASEMLPEELR